jgi:hypothetical protein
MGNGEFYEGKRLKGKGMQGGEKGKGEREKEEVVLNICTDF